MPQLSLQNRHQIQMLSWEQFISCDNEVRVIDAFVDYLNLQELGFNQKGQSYEGRSTFPMRFCYTVAYQRLIIFEGDETR